MPDIAAPDGKPMHVHWFGDDASIMGDKHMEQHLTDGGDMYMSQPSQQRRMCKVFAMAWRSLMCVPVQKC